MKKLLVILTILVTFSATGQNLQLHYDFERGFYMSTFEMFRIDKYGFSYAFVDFDYDAKNGISRGHEKIVRVLKTEKMPLGLEVAYEGIVGTYEYPGQRYRARDFSLGFDRWRNRGHSRHGDRHAGGQPD